MHISPACTELVTAWEGLPDGDKSTVNLDPYLDPVSIWTIGYGRALRDPASGRYLKGVKDRAQAFGQFPGGITRDRAVAMLAEDLAKEEALISALVTPGTTQSQFNAAVSFNFNTGGFANSTLRRLLRDGGPAGTLGSDAAIKALAARVRGKAIAKPATLLEGFAVWSFGNKVFLGGLFCRRLAEWTLCSGATASAANALGAHVRSVIAH